MKPISFTCVLVACTAAVLVAGSARAQTTTEAKCRGTIAKNLTKYQASLIKSVAGCHKQRNLNKAPYNTTDCNDVWSVDAIKPKLAATKGKITAAINKSCAEVSGVQTSVLEQFPRCPSPSAAVDNGGTTGIDDFTELSACLTDLSEKYANRIAKEAFGLPPVVPTSEAVSTCSAAIGKTLGKALRTYGKVRSKCQSEADKAGQGFAYQCANGDDIKGSIALANGALNDAIEASCNGTPSTLASMGACGQTAAQLKTCITDRVVKRVGGGLVAAAYELPAGNCPAYADVLVNAGYGSQRTASELDFGYTGNNHNVDINDGSLAGVAMSGCDPDCENCWVTLDRSPAGRLYAGYSTCRCDNDATVACNLDNAHIEIADPACGGNVCHCYSGPPVPLSGGNTPVCVVNRYQQQFMGWTRAVGEYVVGTRTAALVHLGIGLVRPCPTCVGDTGDNDGTRAGSCSGGQRNMLPCDVNANNPDFGPVSFDCQPSIVANISGPGLKMALVFTDETQVTTAAIPTGALCTAGTCHCAQCSLDSSMGCSSNAECAAFGAGTCTNVTVAAAQQNSCVALDCVDDGSSTNQGFCGNATPPVAFCDGQLRGNGRGYIQCSNQGDCDAMDSGCDGGDCGICDGGLWRRDCFPTTITATGIPGVFGSEAVTTFCAAATSDSGVNAAYGLPGPGRLRLDLDFTPYCADHGTPYDLPGGSNCP